MGGLNAACFAFDKVDKLVELWENISNAKVYKPSGFIEVVSSIYCGEKIDSIEKFNLANELSELYKNMIQKYCILDNAPLEGICKELFSDKKISDSSVDLFITAVELQANNLVHFGKDKNYGDIDALVADALMATSAIQLIFPVRLFNEKQYIDGGNGANLPLKYAIDHQCNRIILARSNVPEKAETKLFKNPVEVLIRAYVATLNNLTTRDKKWANDISKRIKKEKENLERLILFAEQITDVETKKKYSELIELIKKNNIFDNKIPIKIIKIVPDWAPGNIIDFDNTKSRDLIKHGYEKAKENLDTI